MGHAAKQQRRGGIAWAIGASLILHGILLCVHFASPPPAPPEKAPIELAVLLNTKTREAPQSAAMIAQANLNGGGTLSEKGWTPSAPVERGQSQPTPEADGGEGSEERRVKQLESEVAAMMAQMRRAAWMAPQARSGSQEVEARPVATRQQIDLAARIDARAQAYASRPKKSFVGLRAKESDVAAWMDAWQKQVESIGTEFYPQAGGGERARGSLVLTVGVRGDGSVESIRVEQSSGQAWLDEAAKGIVIQAAPFGAFHEAMSKRIDILYITRQWRFGPAGLQALEAPG